MNWAVAGTVLSGARRQVILVMRRRSHFHILGLSLLSALAGGCVSEQYSEFRGAVTHEGAPAAPVQQLGGQFHYRDEKLADAVTGFSLPESKGVLLFVHDREKYETRDFRLTNDGVSGVYFVEWSLGSGEPWKHFVGLDEPARHASEGVHRLTGSFDVERWKSNVDFRIQLAMRSVEPEPVVVDGLLTTSERQEFRPGQWFAMTLWSLGLVGPSQAKPVKSPAPGASHNQPTMNPVLGQG